MIQVMLTRKVDSQGRVVLPKQFRQELDIQPEESLVMSLKQGEIFIEKQSNQLKEKRMCYITGLSSTDCHTFSGGIDLSKEAAMQLLLEIQSKR